MTATDVYTLWTRRLSRGLLLGGAAIVLVGLVGALFAQAADLQGSQVVHVQLEYFGVFAAISIFFLSSAKYAISRERIYLPLSLGFLGAAIFDLLHPLMPPGGYPATIGGIDFIVNDLNGYLWWMGRVSFGVGFLAAGIALRQQAHDDQPARLLVRGLVWTLGEVMALTLLLVILPLPAYYGAGGVYRGLELLPIALFAAAVFILVRPDLPVERPLRIVGGASLGLAGFAQVAAALSDVNGDPLFVLAHVVKVASYLVVLFGLYLEHVNLYAQERQLRQSVEEAEREAIQRRGELFAVIENTADGIAITDSQGRIVHLNRAAQRILGCPSPDAWIGTPLAGHIQPIPWQGEAQDTSFVDTLAAAVEKGAEVRHIEIRLGDPEHPHYLNVGVVPLHNSAGEFQGVIADLHDVTNLRLAERRYRELTEGAPDGIIEMERDGTIGFFNKAAERIFGYSKDEVLGRDVTILMPERMQEPHTQARGRFFETGVSRLAGRPLELPALRKDGREITIELTLSHREGVKDSPVTGILRDVQHLQRTRREKDALVAIADAVSATTDVRSLCARAAPALREALRYESVTVFVKSPNRPVLEVLGIGGPSANDPGKPPSVKLEPTDPPLAAKAFLAKTPQVASGKTGRAQEIAKAAPTPLRDDSLVIVVPILAGNDALGVIGGVTSSHRHLPDEEISTLQTVALQLALGISQKLLVQELQDTARSLSATNRELDAFIYTASHDLAEPLRSMANFSQFLLEDYSKQLDPQAQDYLKRIHDGAIRMRGLLDALLQVSRIRHRPLPFETVDTAKLLQEVRESLDLMIREKNAEVVVRDPLPPIFAQPPRVMEVFSNLLSNGLKFNEAPKPRVEVSGAVTDGFVEFRVSDNGIGIPEKYQDRVFGLFTRLHPRGQYPGTGAGLAIVRTIIEQHGGQVRLESKEGQGTTVVFTLPKEPT